MLVKLDHFPGRDENKKYFSCHHLTYDHGIFRLKQRTKNLKANPALRCAQVHPTMANRPKLWKDWWLGQKTKNLSGWWLEPTHLKNMRKSNWIISPGIRVKIRNIWKAHLEKNFHSLATSSIQPWWYFKHHRAPNSLSLLRNTSISADCSHACCMLWESLAVSLYISAWESRESLRWRYSLKGSGSDFCENATKSWISNKLLWLNLSIYVSSKKTSEQID